MCHKHSRQLRRRNGFPIQYERVTSETTFLLTGQGNKRIDRQFENDINETRIKIVKIATIGTIFLRYKRFLLKFQHQYTFFYPSSVTKYFWTNVNHFCISNCNRLKVYLSRNNCFYFESWIINVINVSEFICLAEAIQTWMRRDTPEFCIHVVLSLVCRYPEESSKLARVTKVDFNGFR